YTIEALYMVCRQYAPTTTTIMAQCPMNRVHPSKPPFSILLELVDIVHNLVKFPHLPCRTSSPHKILPMFLNRALSLSHIFAFMWIRISTLFLLPGCCDPFNEKALRASRGASFQLPIVSGTWTHLEALINKFHLKILAGHPESNEQLKPVSRLSQGLANSLANLPLCLVLGGKGSGLSAKTRQVCELVSIPMVGQFESLNVSVADGIFLYMLQPENHRFA
ncbi:hypothetical protein LOK49_LG03G00522, partial [Camellia lanceoleosa]